MTKTMILNYFIHFFENFQIRIIFNEIKEYFSNINFNSIHVVSIEILK